RSVTLPARPAALNCVVGARVLVISVLFINRIPPSHEQLLARYDFSRDFFVRTLYRAFSTHRQGLSGFGAQAYYPLRAEPGQVAAGVSAALIVFAAACLLPAGLVGDN